MRPTLKDRYNDVELPAKNITKHRNKKNDAIYIYHVGKGYRNKNGKPTSDKTLIGRLNAENGMLTPNDKYFEIYGEKIESPKAPKTQPMEIDSIKNFGDWFLLSRIVKEIGLDRILKNIFGSQSESLILMAIYVALEGNVLFYCEDFCEETLTDSNLRISSQQCSSILQSITEEKRMEFFRTWVNVREEEEYLAYDVTSISSYSKNNDNVEYGYNRDGEELPQINMGVYYGETSLLPVYYRAYTGSINDVSHLQYMMRDNERLGMKKCRFVMDRGFFSKDNLTFLVSNKETSRFTIGMPINQKIPSSYVDKYGDRVDSSRYTLKSNGIKGASFECNDYGFRSNIHIYFSNEKKASDEHCFNEKLRDWEGKLQAEKSIPKTAEKYFLITESDDETQNNIDKNYDAIDEHIKQLGYFLLLTTDLSKSSGEILDIYRNKDLIEKCFNNVKNQLDMKRLRIHSAEAQEGKMFISFLALIIRAFVQKKLTVFLDNNQPFTMTKIFKELRKIKVVKTSSGLSLLAPLTKKQKDILDAFNLNSDDLINHISSR